jgi:hypothetical protein
MSQSETEINALISLLSETGPESLILIKNKLVELKRNAIPLLKEVLTHSNL